jgi:hypothetical protein
LGGRAWSVWAPAPPAPAAAAAAPSAAAVCQQPAASSQQPGAGLITWSRCGAARACARAPRARARPGSAPARAAWVAWRRLCSCFSCWRTPTLGDSQVARGSPVGGWDTVTTPAQPRTRPAWLAHRPARHAGGLCAQR